MTARHCVVSCLSFSTDANLVSGEYVTGWLWFLICKLNIVRIIHGWATVTTVMFFIIRDVSGEFTKDSGSREPALLFESTRPAPIHQLSKKRSVLGEGEGNIIPQSPQEILPRSSQRHHESSWKGKVTFRIQLLHHPEYDRSGSQVGVNKPIEDKKKKKTFKDLSIDL